MIKKDFKVLKRIGLAALVLLAVVVSLQTAIVKQPPNYLIFTNASQNILRGENPYAPQTGFDYYKYSPLAGLLMIPFLVLPVTVGMFLFVLLQFGLFTWAFWRWKSSAHLNGLDPSSVALVAFFSTVFDVTVSLQNCQVNVGIFALMLLAMAQYAEGKYVRAGLILALATNLKLFPFTLGLCLLMGFQKKYWVAFWGGLLLCLALPALVVGAQFNMHLVADWVGLMTWDQTRTLDMLDIGNFLNLHFGMDPGIRDFLAVAVGLFIGFGTFALIRKHYTELVDRFLLPINGLFVLVFSYLSESSTSVLATAGIFLIAIEALADKDRRWLYWVLWSVSVMLVPLFYSDLVPKDWSEWARGFHLKTVGYVYILVVLSFIFYRRYRGRGLPDPGAGA